MKIVKAIYFIWVFVNCYCLLDGISARGGNIFDYSDYRLYSDEYDYLYDDIRTVKFTALASGHFEIPFANNINFDLTELFVYIGIPVLFYFLVGYVRK